MNKILSILYVVGVSMVVSCSEYSDAGDCSEVFETMATEFSKRQITYRRYELSLQQQGLDPKTLAYDSEGRPYAVEHLIRDSHTLIFRYSNLSCNSCFAPVLHALNAFHQRQPNQRVLILASYDNLRAFSSFHRSNRTTIPLYFIYPKDSKGPLAPDVPPYLFVAGADLSIEVPYVVGKELPGAVEGYLEALKAEGYL